MFPQQCLLILLSLCSFSLILLSPSFCTQFEPSVLNADRSPCDGIMPFPFGYVYEALDGFELTCRYFESYHSPGLSLQLGSNYYRIKNISVDEGYIIIVTGPLSILCSNDSVDGSGLFDLVGTPYTLSTRNKLTVIGCNSLALMIGNTGHDPATGCIPFCNEVSSNDVAIYSIDSCSGFACCQAAIPKGIKSFNFKLSSISTGPSLLQCSQAFFVDQEITQFRNETNQLNIGNETYHEVILEWAIGKNTCQEAKKNSESFACKNNSYCYDWHNGVGYRCNCRAGYTGNPYDKDGCVDIDECANPKLNPCVEICQNSQGNVSCACPRGKRGDGRKNGSGCENVFPMEIALGVNLGSLFVLISGSFWSYWLFKKRELMNLKTKFFRQNGGLMLQQQIASQGNTNMKIFSVEELRKATDNFNESHILGRGGYGTVYKGVLPDHTIVAIKKSRSMDESQIEQFINEVVILSQVIHRNVVKLLGCCLETQVPLLVYEFISNGSLFQHIHSKDHLFLMSWDNRLRIAAETAGALAYLHSAASIPIIHRDVKSANILLDSSYTAKVSDFGASRSVPFDQTHATTLVQGTLGYLDPEYFRTSKLTEKSDVYSFGIVLVELMTGEMPVSFARSEIFRNLASYFTVLFDENWLLKVIEVEILAEAGTEQIFSVAQIVKRCMSSKGEERPTMKEVAMELEGLRRFRKQQMIDQHKREELECLLGQTQPSNLNTGDVEMSRQLSLENHMILSADFPR